MMWGLGLVSKNMSSQETGGEECSNTRNPILSLVGIRRGRKHVRVAGIFLGKIFNAVKTILGKKIMNKKVGNILHVPTIKF